MKASLSSSAAVVLEQQQQQKQKQPDDLIRQADSFLTQMDHENALRLYQAALPLAQAESLCYIYEKMADCKVALGDPDGAKPDYERALQETTEDDDTKRASMLMYIGQLSTDEEALGCYRKGIQHLGSAIDRAATSGGGGGGGKTLEELRQQLAQAHCAVAELFMTDLCFNEDAEQQCETSVRAALQYRAEDSGLPLIDALQAQASLCLSQSNTDSAREHMEAVYRQIKKGCEALAGLIEGTSEELRDADAVSALPNFEFRVQTAQLLMETGQAAPSALTVLKSLMAENDEVVRVWFLMGCAYCAAGDKDMAREYWERALEMLVSVKESLEMDEGDDDDDTEMELQECETQMEEIKSRLEDLDEDDEDEDGDGDEIMMT